MFLLNRRKAKLKSAEKPDRSEVHPSRTNKRGPAKTTAPASSTSKGKDRLIEQTDTGRPSPSAQPKSRTQSPPPEPSLRRSERKEARQTPEYVDDDHLPEGVDSYGNPDPKYPHKITPEERSLLKIIKGDAPDVDWIADGAGYPAFRRINTALRIRAALGQRIGTIARDENGEPCERCARDIGPFKTCKTFNLGRKMMFSGSCMSCAFSNSGNRCTLRAGKKRPTIVKDPRVTADGAISRLEAKVATLKKQPALVLGADARILPSRLKKVIRELENMVVYIENSLAEKNPEKNPDKNPLPLEENPPPPGKNPPLQKKNRPTFPLSLLAESSRCQDKEMQDADTVIRDDKKKRWNSTMEENNRPRASNQQLMTKKGRGLDQPSKRADIGNNSRGASLSRAEVKLAQMTDQKVVVNKNRVPDQPNKRADIEQSSGNAHSSRAAANPSQMISQQMVSNKNQVSVQSNTRDTGHNSANAYSSRADVIPAQMLSHKVVVNDDRVPDQPIKITDKEYSSKDGVSSKDIKNQTPAIDRQNMTNKERASDQPMEGTDKGHSPEDEDSSNEISESSSDRTSQGSIDESDWTSSDE